MRLEQKRHLRRGYHCFILMKYEIAWSEKYRPSTLAEIAGNKQAKAALQKWAETWSGREPPEIRAAILSGPPGVGKTSSAIALAKEFGWDFIEMNASDKRGEKEIRRVVIPGSGTNTFAQNGEYFSIEKGKRHLIILDEADNIHSREDRGGIAAVSDLIRNTLQPVVLIVNDLFSLTKRSEFIKKSSKVIKFENIGEYELASIIHRIADAEGISISRDAALKLIEQSSGDARAAINDLQAISIRKVVTLEDVLSMKKRDKTVELRDGLATLFKSDSPGKVREILGRFDEDPEHISLWIDENLPYYVENIDRLAGGYAMLALATEFLERAGRLSYYKFWSYSSELMGIGASNAARGSSHSPLPRFPYMLMRIGYRNSLIRSRASMEEKIAGYCHCSIAHARDDVIPFFRSAFKSSDQFALSMIGRLSFTVEDVSNLIDEPEDSERISRLLGKMQVMQAAK
jgi:replication factor C large subunit